MDRTIRSVELLSLARSGNARAAIEDAGRLVRDSVSSGDAAAAALGRLAAAEVLVRAAVTLVQTDLKRLVAYSSISHMGYVMLGMASMTPEGLNGAVLQMFNHGVVTAMLFLLVGVLYDRAHHRELDGFGGIWSFGGAPAIQNPSPYWGWDIARKIKIKESSGKTPEIPRQTRRPGGQSGQWVVCERIHAEEKISQPLRRPLWI